MKVIKLLEGGQVQHLEVKDPISSGDFVVVKIHVAPMCTEYKSYLAQKPAESLGHEAAGEVVDVAQPGRVSIGDRVVVMPTYPCGACPYCLGGDYIHCQHNLDMHRITGNETGSATYAQYVVKQDWLLLPIPEGMSYEHASMACCGLGPTFGAMEAMRVGCMDTVLISGLGPVGLGGVINASYRGGRVMGLEPNPYRRDLALRLGAEMVMDPQEKDSFTRLMDATERKGVDKAVDCSGNPSGQRWMIDAMKRRGHACFVGEGGEFTVRVSDDLIRKGLTVQGIWHYNLKFAFRMMRLIQEVPGLLDRMITHTFPMSRVQDAFELQGTGLCGKILLNPWE